ncbi:GNAT family N-acetyltransferase [Streptomyces aureus]|uniref:GNAT family N-acetyltransferase n=1 Tax=Streptomyces aureus TaxID=193461 RepID=UPI0033D3C3EB
MAAQSLTWLDLSRAEDVRVFEGVREEWLALLKASYGDLNHRDDIHVARVHEPGCQLLLATLKGRNGTRLVGCSYVNENGRRAATAVAPAYRGRGLGNAIVRETVKRVPYQFSEVRPANLAQRGILERNGFLHVADPVVVRRILGRRLSALIVPGSADETEGSYMRISHDAARTSRYVMYERPREPVPVSPSASGRTEWRRSPGGPRRQEYRHPVSGPST